MHIFNCNNIPSLLILVAENHPPYPSSQVLWPIFAPSGLGSVICDQFWEVDMDWVRHELI